MAESKPPTRMKIKELGQKLSDTQIENLSFKQCCYLLQSLIKYDEWENGPE